MTKPIALDLTNAIVAAVLPAKEAAVARAEKEEREYIARLLAKLEADGGDINVSFAYPKDHWARDYKAAKARRSYVSMVSENTEEKIGWHMGPVYRRVANEQGIERMIEQAKTEAAAGYDAFVAKLVAKIGPASAATLAGDHVWGHSVLTVTKEDGSIERWKTQQIVNRSIHNLLFNQWPSRKMK